MATINKYAQTIAVIALAMVFTACGASRKTHPNTASKEKIGTSSVYKRLGIDAYPSNQISLLEEIANWIGTPYKYGGSDKRGTDCSGFINAVYKEVYNLKLARSTAQLEEESTPVSERKITEGDLVFFNIKSKKAGHAGIYLHDGYFAHASTSRGVMISRLSEEYWNKYYAGAGRVLKNAVVTKHGQ